MPKKASSEVSQAEAAARARGFKGNRELAEQFGISDDNHRELVRVDYIPDPPPTEAVEKVVTGRKRRKPETLAVSPDDFANTVLREAAGEICTRLERIGIAFTPQMQQQYVDYGMAILSGLVGGGTLAAR